MSKQLKSIIAQFRQVRDDGVKHKVDIIDAKSHEDESDLVYTGKEMMELIERIRRVRVVGQKKILLRLDEKHDYLLEQLKPVFGLDVTHFVNYIISEFLETNPQLRNSLKKL